MPDILQVVGRPWSRKSHEVKDYLARYHVFYQWMDADGEESQHALHSAGVDASRLPVLLFPDGSVLAAPSEEEIATELGLVTENPSAFHDLVIVGGGPTGLAAAVYAASEGLRTLVVEKEAPGGQAGTSARIENFLGFPEGLSGGELAQRAVEQAKRFGTEFLAAHEATTVRAEGPYRVVTLADGTEL